MIVSMKVVQGGENLVNATKKSAPVEPEAAAEAPAQE